MMTNELPRILVVDDEPEVLRLFADVLQAQPDAGRQRLQQLASNLFGDAVPSPMVAGYAVDLCRQGDEAVARLQHAQAAGPPYRLAFIDYRMPPGPNGAAVAARMRALDPQLEIVLVTAYADLGSDEICQLVPPADQLLLLKKPLHTEEIRQVAASLCAKWALARSLEQQVQKRGDELATAQSRLQTSAAFYRTVFESTGTLTAILDPAATICLANSGLLRSIGRDAAAVTGQLCWLDLLPPEQREAVAALHVEALTDAAGQPRSYECRLQGGNGAWMELLVTVAAIPGSDRCVVSAQDFSRQKAQEQQLRSLSCQDPLTSLWNRSELMRRLDRRLASQRRDGDCFALLLLDLNRFKNLNDSLGHTTGDEVLLLFSQRFASLLAPGESLARLGGDEFVLLLDPPVEPARAGERAEALLAACQRPLTVAGRSLVLTASIGVLLADPGYRQAVDLLRDVDIALSCAKRQGPGTWQMFRPEMRQRVQQQLELEQSLRQGIAGGELELYYQPVVTLPGGQLAGVEALVRWRRSQGLVPPGEFIPLAEESGLILPLGAEVLRLACRQLRQWREQGVPLVPVSVNISARQLTSGDLLADLLALLQQEDVPPKLLMLEFTESALMEQTEEVIARLHALRNAGLRLCLDDFGTGFSSLSYLQRFEVDVIKIDRSFVAEMHRPRTEALVRSLLFLGRRMNVKVVAEGIETPVQAAQLAAWGCPFGQGFHFGRPMPPEQLSLPLAAASG